MDKDITWRSLVGTQRESGRTIDMWLLEYRKGCMWGYWLCGLVKSAMLGRMLGDTSLVGRIGSSMCDCRLGDVSTSAILGQALGNI